MCNQRFSLEIYGFDQGLVSTNWIHYLLLEYWNILRYLFKLNDPDLLEAGVWNTHGSIHEKKSYCAEDVITNVLFW